MKYKRPYKNWFGRPVTRGEYYKLELRLGWNFFKSRIEVVLRNFAGYVKLSIKKRLPKKTTPLYDGYNTYHLSDIEAYHSPISNKVIEGRVARREEMKRHNVREVDPSEKPKEGQVHW
jgi:hypothetical protein